MSDDEYFPCYKPFNIKEGSHSSGFKFRPLWEKSDFRIEVVFGDECAYPSFGDVDDHDINKLFGISWGLHNEMFKDYYKFMPKGLVDYIKNHTNSYRIGWRSDQNGGIILSDYYYIDGKRSYNDICTVPTNRNVTIEFDRGYVAIMTVKDTWTSKVCVGNDDKWGYTLFPYFGGNKTAPNDMEILLKIIR